MLVTFVSKLTNGDIHEDTRSMRYTFACCLQNCFNSSWHGSNKVLETFLRDFGPYGHDGIKQ